MHALFRFFSGHFALLIVLLTASVGGVQASTQQTEAEQRYLAWKQLDGNGYVFANAGVAFFDTKMKSRKPNSGTLTITSTDKDETGPAMSLGYGWHMQRYFAFEVSYHHIPKVEYSGTFNATSANLDGNSLNGNMNYQEEITVHGIGLTLVGGTYDVFESVGFTLRAGGFLYDIRDEYTLTGSGTLNGSAITTTNNTFDINSNGATWTGGASLFWAPSLHSRLELRYDYVDGMKIEDFDKVSMAVASLGYRYRY